MVNLNTEAAVTSSVENWSESVQCMCFALNEKRIRTTEMISDMTCSKLL